MATTSCSTDRGRRPAGPLAPAGRVPRALRAATLVGATLVGATLVGAALPTPGAWAVARAQAGDDEPANPASAGDADTGTAPAGAEAPRPEEAAALGVDVDTLAEQRALEAEAAEEQLAADAQQAREDADRPGWRKWLWADASAGYTFANLDAIRYDALVPGSVSRTSSGFTTSVGTGLRLFFVTLGGRYTFSTYGDFQLQSAGGELGFRIPAGVLEPFLRVGLAYGWLDADLGENVDPNIDGAALDVGAGLDVWVHPFVTVGFAFQTGVFFLNRDAVEACLRGACGDDLELGESGTATALQARIELRAGLHI